MRLIVLENTNPGTIRVVYAMPWGEIVLNYPLLCPFYNHVPGKDVLRKRCLSGCRHYDSSGVYAFCFYPSRPRDYSLGQPPRILLGRVAFTKLWRNFT